MSAPAKQRFQLPDVDAMYRDMAKRLENFCTCSKCGATQEVDAAECLRTGWPKCCGVTMYLGKKS